MASAAVRSKVMVLLLTHCLCCSLLLWTVVCVLYLVCYTLLGVISSSEISLLMKRELGALL